MKKSILIIIIIGIFLLTDASIVSLKRKKVVDNEVRAIYISYLEYYENFINKTKSISEDYINNMLDNIKGHNFNTIFLHISPFSDAIYNSKIFPYSETLTGIEGKNPGFDFLEYFIKIAHQKELRVHAWINPYRIRNDNQVSKISSDNPAYNLLDTNHVKVSKSGIYYNPASEIVKGIIISQIKEILNLYDVDGIHFDDYFYVIQDIDQQDYSKYIETNDINLEEYRLMIVNNLIKTVYKIIKDYDEKIIFSISPDGNLNNNYKYHFADVKAWGSSNQYIDWLMPQIYYGFENEYLPFAKAVNEWENVVTNKNVKLLPVLAFYKTGQIDNDAGSGKNEWLENNNIIQKQIEVLRNKNYYYGYTLFRYDFIFNYPNDISKQELNNLMK